MEITPAKSVVLVIGETGPVTTALTTSKPALPRRQTATIRHHDSIVGVLEKHNVATDGSQVILKPGTNEPFEYEDDLYASVEDGLDVLVVPNRPGQVGGEAVKAPGLRPKVAAPAPAPVFHNKLLRDPTKSLMASDKYSVPGTDGQFHYRPDVLVKSAAEEAAARADGYTEEIAAPVGA